MIPGQCSLCLGQLEKVVRAELEDASAAGQRLHG